MREDFTDAKVGDKVVVCAGGWSNYRYVETIQRLTKTQVIVKSGRYRRNNGHTISGVSQYSKSYITPVTDELIEDIRRCNRRSLVERFGLWKKATDDEISQLFVICKAIETREREKENAK